MLLIKNDQAEPIQIIYNGEIVIINGNESYAFKHAVEGALVIKHYDFLNHYETRLEKIIVGLAKSSVLIIDSPFFVSNISEEAIISIQNAVYENPAKDFGYLYFKIIPKNCKAYLGSGDPINLRQILQMQRMIRIGDALDFPPFSIVMAIYSYYKTRKLCSTRGIMEILQLESVAMSV